MSKTAFSARIKQAIRYATLAEKRGWSQAQLQDYIAEDRSRRDFLQKMALTSMTPLLAYCAPPRSATNGGSTDQASTDEAAATPDIASAAVSSASKTTPVLILGAGAAGLTAAYALKKGGLSFMIAEADSSRVGGRIFTKRNYNSQGQFIEAGAEFVDTDHSTLIGLANKLGVQMQTIYNAQQVPEVYWVGGRAYQWSDLVNNISPFMKEINNAINNGADYLNYTQYAKNTAAKRYDNMSTAQFFASMNGKVENWVLTVMGIEAVAEFGLDLDQMSSINSIFDLDTSVSDFRQSPADIESMRIKGGNSTLIDALAAQLPAGSLLMGAQVIAMAKSGSNIKVTFQQGSSTFDITANQVINTLPFTTLRNVSGLSALGLSAAKLACINGIGMGTNSKVILEFKQKPWLQNGVVAASAGTVYTDLPSQSFWDSSRGQVGTNGLVVNYTGGARGAAISSTTAAQQALPDLSKVYPDLAGGMVSSFYANWTQAPNARGSYACMKVGQFQQFNGAQGSAELSGKLLFAGEACDQDYPGYMEGAFRTGLAAANKILAAQNRPRLVVGYPAGPFKAVA